MDFAKKLEKIFGIKISDKELFEKALTHPSVLQDGKIDGVETYQRLEFLGDAVLKLCISEVLYKKYPKYAEGELSKIRSIVVSDNTLAGIAKEEGLEELIILGQDTPIVPSICACVFEAVLGAFYLDGSLDKVHKYLKKRFTNIIVEVDKHFEEFNAKGILQEYTQGINSQTPCYKIVEEKGPSHNKTFVMEVSFESKVLGCGEGKTKKEAEQKCALEACKKLKIVK